MNRSHKAAGDVPGLAQPIIGLVAAEIQSGRRQNPFQRDPLFVRLILPLAKAIDAYFGTEVRGWKNVPTDRAVLIVGNHSGGAVTTDPAAIFAEWVERLGPKRPLYILGYDLHFAFPIVSSILRGCGLLPADPVVAWRALRRGAAVVVYPGGDFEVFRPWRDRNKIDFGGRTGFIKLAISTGVPVVPMTTHGAHQSTLVLSRGHWIAQRTGLERLRINVFPFIWNIPFGLTPAFVPSLQLPAKVTVQFGKPLDWTRYRPEQASDPKILRRCYREITGVMQKTMDTLAREHPYPVLARLDELRPSHMIGRLLRNGSRAANSESRSRNRDVKKRQWSS